MAPRRSSSSFSKDERERQRKEDDDRPFAVGDVEPLAAHSLGAAFGIENKACTRRLGRRRRAPGQLSRASPADGADANFSASHRCQCSGSQAGPCLALRMMLYHSGELS